MVARRTATAEPTPSRRSSDSSAVLSELENSLAIDRDDLDTCLVEQPGSFYHVAEQVASANARRDTAKLELEEVTATEDGKFRSLLAQNEEKATESGISTHLRTLDNLKALQRELLVARTEADRWLALKEAYQQRSFMLRELVALHLSQIGNVRGEHGASSFRHDVGDRNRERAEQVRRERRTNNG